MSADHSTAAAPAPNLFGAPAPQELFAAIGDPRRARAARRCRRSPTRSAAPAGPAPSRTFRPARPISRSSSCTTSTSRPARRCRAGNLLDLGLIYGDGPKHDAFCYQVPREAGAGAAPAAHRPGAADADLAGLGRRARPAAHRPARTSTPARSRPAPRCWCRTRFSDSNLLLGQMQMLWALMHNAIAATLAETRAPETAFELARADQPRHLPRRDPPRRARHLADAAVPRPLRRRRRRAGCRRAAVFRTPREFMAGVGRLGPRARARDLCAERPDARSSGLRNLVRHTATGRPHDMPLTEDWLVDFSRFFAIGSSVPQRARALGPHVARPFATGLGVGTDGSADGLVLRDLIACSRGGLRSVRSLIARATRAEPRLFEGCFAQDETNWTARGRPPGSPTPASRRTRSTGWRPTRR